ncbi:aminotransferase [Limibaculum sp. M0105]|uniref:Aminotransferase n=1 Tax=Thermohalobaculum xanthum TaxID=2753746 RepID=A0A8J7M6J4_9RHOB|nr:aminotransferase [Thermohalobaculum xanthum]MBK0399188.1 aminotransferase [Thermohalobaculum xanthum]
MNSVNPETPTAISPETVQKWDNRHFFHPWDTVGGEDADRMIAVEGEGIYLIDPDGRRFIDGPGGMWNVQIGYGRTEMAEAIGSQAMKLAYHSPWAFASEPSALLARRLAAMAPGDLKTVFFATGGSSAVDTALRFAQFYNNLRGLPEKKRFLAREKGYHGSTYLAASVTAKERDGNLLDTEKRLVHFLPNINPYLRPEGMSVEDWCDAKVADLEAAISVYGADTIAAYISEPIMASGGVIVPPPDYHRRTREICRENDILYISDEVVTAFGRLGHWFASEEVFGIVPDIITCAKGLTSGYLPLGATLISDRLMAEICDAGGEDAVFKNGYTYSGHPVCCAAALKNIEIIEREGLLEHVRELTPHFQARLNELRRHPIVGDTRGMGLVGCVEGHPAPGMSERERLAIDQEFGNRVDAKCEAMGLIVRPLINMCVFSPPLIITRPQIDRMFDILDKAIGQVEAEMM